MRLTREESQARTKALLIEAAKSEFIRAGFGAASVRDIAEAAGFSQGAFYSNFESKEQLLLLLMRGHMETENSRINAMLEEDNTHPEILLRQVEAWANQMDADYGWSMLAMEMQLHAHRNTAFANEYEALTNAHLQALGRLVERLFVRCDRKLPTSAVDLAAGFMSLMKGLSVVRHRDRRGMPGRVLMTFLRSILDSAESATAQGKTAKPASGRDTQRTATRGRERRLTH
jgi:AcrR family transcriptional regulator